MIYCTTGDDHKRQKKVMNPAFSPSHLRDIAPTFFECTYKVGSASLLLSEDLANT